MRYLRENGNKPAAVFMLIAEMLGIKETVTNWEQLAGFVF